MAKCIECGVGFGRAKVVSRGALRHQQPERAQASSKHRQPSDMGGDPNK